MSVAAISISCCYGLYHNCWIDPFSEGIWDFSQEDVNILLKGVLKTTRKYLKNKHRALCYKDSNGTHVILIMRDIHRCDYIITFTNILGHADATITINRYAHALEEQKRLAMDKVSLFALENVTKS